MAVTESPPTRRTGPLHTDPFADCTPTKRFDVEADDSGSETEVPGPTALIWIAELRDLLPKGNGTTRNYYAESLIFALNRQRVLAPTCSSCGVPT